MLKQASFLLLIFLFFQTHSFAQSQIGFIENPRQKISLNQSWKFHLGDPDATFYEQKTDDTDWESIHVPHTLELTSLNLDDSPDTKLQETFQRKVGWYRRNIQVADSERKVFLEFEGAHQVTTLWVNGKKVGVHDIGGYTPFHFDITDVIKRGQRNQITLLVDNRKYDHVPPDPGPFDYIKFSGLYRDIYQVETNKVRLPFNWEFLEAGVTFTTPSVDPVNGNATISIKTSLVNDAPIQKELTLVHRLIDKKGEVVLRLAETQTLKSGEIGRFNSVNGIEDNLYLWSTENPYLYRLNTMIYEGDQVLDGVECKVGIRKFEHHPREGFLLNGKPIKLIGMNRHQHYFFIGDAMPDALHYKDMLQLKKLGFNMMRTAHYPHDDAILEACDELGILVYEEAPTWIDIGGEAWFDNLDKAARRMVRNHRNHPSIVIWGGGINHRGYVPRLHYAVKQEDPTRLTASQNSRWTGWQTSGLTDIYGQMVYGPVEWKRHEPMLAMEGRDGIKELAPYLLDPLLTGIIAWTAHDHYSFHPTKLQQYGRIRRVGIMSIFRQPYTETHFYPIELRDEFQLHIASEWEEETNEVIIYSNANEVELLVNGKTIAKATPDFTGMNSAFDHPPFRIPVHEFEAGKLTAKGYVGKQLVAEQSIHTRLKPVGIAIKIDTIGRQFIADGSDIVLAYAHIVDENGMTIADANFEVKFEVQGDASIVGDGANIGANPMATIHGVASVLVKAGTKASDITLTAKAAGLKIGSANLKTVAYNANKNLAQSDEFYDVERLKIDLGSSEQLLQYDWTAWNAKDGEKASQQFDAFGGVEARIEVADADGLLKWLGEMNVMGKYGYAVGEGVLITGKNGGKLSLDLPKGKYRIHTFHHAPRSNTDSMDPNKDQLKTMSAVKLPYAKKIKVQLKNSMNTQSKVVSISEGKMLPEHGVGEGTFSFETNGKQAIVLDFQADGNIWLNALVIERLIK
ncbi:MAG: glycoside hydrolase family 2 TIM barrel-domain containing protein [Bacteroidota bacterium]